MAQSEREQELTEKSARLAQLDALLNMDEKDDVEYSEPESVAAKAVSTVAEKKPSVLATLERNAEKSRTIFDGSNTNKAVKREEAAI